MKQMEKALQERFHRLAYDYLRGIPNLTDKLTIMMIFIFAYQDDHIFSDLLYGNSDLTHWIDHMNDFCRKSLDDSDFRIGLSRISQEEEKCFEEMVGASRKVFDDDRYYKALNEGDEYAVAIYEVCKVVEKIGWKRMKEDWRCVGEMISAHI